MSRIELTPRLRSVAELVPAGCRFADIGTDHAYLPAWLICNGVIDHAIAADLRQGPLDRARQTAERYGVADRMSFRLCDGLSGIAPDEVDTVAIAGMGGETISAILSAAPWTRTRGLRLLLQPMSSFQDLREWLQANGYEILCEKLTREDKRLYVTMEVREGDMPLLTQGELWAGRQWQGMEQPLRDELLSDLIRRADRAADGLEHSHRQEDVLRLAQVRAAAAELRTMREEWLEWQR